jgi:hypothetical protein
LNAEALLLLSEARPWSRTDDGLPSEDAKTSCGTPARVICSRTAASGTFSGSPVHRTSSGIEERRIWPVWRPG